MSLLGDEGDDFDRPPGPLLPPDDRLWRHPSEMAEAARRRVPAPQEARPRSPRPSLSVMTGLVLGAGLTAAAMLLAGTDGHGSDANLAAGGTQARESASGTAGAPDRSQPGAGAPSTPSGGKATGTAAGSASAAGSGVAARSVTGGGDGHRDTAAVPGDLTSGARLSRQSVVRVAADRGGAALAGYGVELATPGVVLTTDSLIDSVDDVSVTDGAGNRLMATVVGTDPVTDVGVLRVQTTSWYPIALSTAQPWDTEVVSAWTYPNQIYLGQISSTWINADVPGRQPMLGSLGADIPLPADSLGTPLVSQNGQLVGMVGAVRTGGAPVLAVSASTAQAAVESLLSTGSVPHGWIGVEQAVAVQGGVRMVQIDPDSPAARAGLVDGDVVTAVEGQAMQSVDDLWAAVRLRQPGTQVEVSYLDTTRRSADAEVTLGDLNSH